MRDTARPFALFRASVFTSVLCLLALFAVRAQAPATLTPAERALADRVSEARLRTDLTYLASDELAGRATPSPGQETAARYIAAAFQHAGLEPAGDEDYFQDSSWKITTVERRGRTSRRPVPADQAPEVEGPLVTLRNVVGLLRGSDPVLRDEYVIVCAHYDHLGIRSGAAPDSIYNGADDNGSGTVTVMEMARALAMSGDRPRRSILFITWFGEEIGLLGSSWYAAHPVVPLAKTVGVVNLEMTGRTDGDGGDQTNRVSFTGFDFSDLPALFVPVGEAMGIEVFKHEQNSDRYFFASDNIALARTGVVAHTICGLFEYPDYHQLGDEVSKIDFADLTRTARLLTVGMRRLADRDQPPAWNAAKEQAAPFIEAWRKLHGLISP
jgi:hypothetical protein